MALAKDKVVVLKGVNFSEADRIITVFGSKRGRFALIAKGVRKIESKNRPSVQTLAISSITYYEGRNLGSLVEASVEFAPILDHQQVKEISKVLLMVNKMLPEDEPEVEVYSRLTNLVQGDVSRREVNKFRMWLLEYLGYLPDMRRCTNCDSDKDLKFINISNLQMFCSGCAADKRLGSTLHPVTDVKYESDLMDTALERVVNEIIES